MPTRPMLEWRKPETPEEQVEPDNVCRAILDILADYGDRPVPDYNPGEVRTLSDKEEQR